MFNKQERALIWLDSFNLTYHKKQLLLELYDKPSELFDNFLKDKTKLVDLLDNATYDKMAYSNTDDYVDDYIKGIESKNTGIITMYSDNYPECLKNIDSPPFVMYYKGDISLINKNCFAIVGTRRITNYGRTITDMFTKGLVDGGFCIVSGLSSGVDTVAHETALNLQGKTIAVLAGGFDYIYPPTNNNLAKQIEKCGLLLTECKPTQKAEPYYFPIRNRIIAGLSKGVLITEADEKSGSMHTKNYALDNNIDVYAVPGNITSSVSRGCNRIICNGQAKAVVEISDILDEYNIKYQPKQQSLFEVSPQEQLVLDIIGEQEMPFAEILIKTKLDVKTLTTLLTSMSIRGIIKKLAGNIYSR